MSNAERSNNGCLTEQSTDQHYDYAATENAPLLGEQHEAPPTEGPMPNSGLLCSMSSVIYAMLLVGFGIALPLTKILISRNFHDSSSHNISILLKGEKKDDVLSNIFDGYYMCLYFISVAFIAVNTYVTGSLNRNNAQNYFGSSILRNSGIIFAILTIIYSCLDAYTADNHSMSQMVAVVRVLMTLSQTAFIFNTTKEIIPKMQNWKKFSSFGLMHIMATNVCEWILIIIDEARDDMIHPTNGLHDLQANAAFYLFPFSVEYSLICALIAYEIWKKVNSKNDSIVAACDYGDYNILPRSTFALIVTLVQLSSTIVIAILFFERVNSRMLTEIYCLIIISVATVILGYIMSLTRNMEENVHLIDNEEEQRKMNIDITLLVTSLFGAFLLSIFNIIAQSLYFIKSAENIGGTKFTNIVGIAFETITIVEKSLQTLLILNLSWKKSVPNDTSRDIISIILFSNFNLWLINAFIDNTAYLDRNNNELSHDAWIIITHITLPSEIFYRFHSMVCYFEILKNVYGPRPEYGLSPH